MGPLAAVERFLERLFERQSARLFHTSIRPVQVQRRLERAMEGDRSRDGARTIVPHRFVIRMHPDELASLRAASPDLAATFADGALAFARAHGYTLLDRPIVILRPDPGVQAGDVDVDAGDQDVPRIDTVDAGRDGAARTDPEPDDPLPSQDGGPAQIMAGQPFDHTAVFVVPEADGPRAAIREIRPDGTSRTVSFDGRRLTIGRSPDNGLVLRDGRASRHHARIDARRGTLVLSDLGSTNGSFVNDRRVDTVALGEGDRVRIGATTLLVEAIDAASSAGPNRAGADTDAGRDPIDSSADR